LSGWLEKYGRPNREAEPQAGTDVPSESYEDLQHVSSLESARKDIVLHLSSKDGLSSDSECYRMSCNIFLAALAH
jgi:hypothetical protein